MLDQGLDNAIRHHKRLVVLVTGKPRNVDRSGALLRTQGDNQSSRGIIRAKVEDWLALSRHADKIAAIRPAHPKHGGQGALYLVLRRPR